MKKTILYILSVISLLAGFSTSAQKNPVLPEDMSKPRIRVIIDNDFGGDPDGLFQLAHQILSPSVEIRGIIGSFIRQGGFFDAPETASSACNAANELLTIMKMNQKLQVYEGSNSGLLDLKTPQISDGAKVIVKEAMLDDTELPLYVLCGAGLTDIASAYLMEPRIARRLTLIWIGGPEYADLAIPPPGYTPLEYNLGIDIKAGQVIFNNSDIPVWQVPRNAYRQALLSYSELLLKVKTQGNLGEYLTDKIEYLMKLTPKYNFSIGETYILGDNPLVLLTALQSSYDADPSSSSYIIKPAPGINDNGLYETNLSARNIRVYNDLDIRLMFEDFFMKLALFNMQK